MRRFLPLVALLFALSVAPAQARDAGTISCMVPLGPGGSMTEVTLAAEAGGCPGPGEAIPARWLIEGPAKSGVAGASVSSTQRPSTADIVAAQHAIAGGALPDLIVGHGVLGRLLARIAVASGAAPIVWEAQPGRREGGRGYDVVDPQDDPRRDYRAIYDVSGDS